MYTIVWEFAQVGCFLIGMHAGVYWAHVLVD